jgi:hypothetical protein
MIRLDRRRVACLNANNKRRNAMISLEDCLALCGLSEAEVLALAEHEHVPEIVAASLGSHLLCQPNGGRQIGAMIADDVVSAVARGDGRHAAELRATLQAFVASHPEAMASLRTRQCIAGLANGTSCL